MCGHHHHNPMGHGQHGQHAQHTPPTAQEDPKRIVQLRYARGEISREEYLQILADLEQAETGSSTAGHTHTH